MLRLSKPATIPHLLLFLLIILTFLTAPKGFAIVNGQLETDHPAVGFVSDGDGHSGSAVLIDPYWVLTSAEFALAASEGMFYLGLDRAAPEATYPIAAFFPHMNYVPYSWENNIALLRLATPATSVAPIPYLTNTSLLYAGRAIKFVGYGWTSQEEGSNTVRHSCTSEVMDLQWLTFFSMDSSTGPYLGDIGGPALLNVGGEMFVAGLVSAFDSGNFGTTISTRVAQYAAFIQNIMETNPPPTGVVEAQPARRLLNTWPNPFNPTIEISFALGNTEFCSLAVFDPRGYKVTDLADRWFVAGPHTVKWNGRSDAGQNMPSGVYFILFQAGNYSETGKIVLAR